MLGAIIGDVIGSVFENRNTKRVDFDLFSRFSSFTDDTVLTIAIAEAILIRSSNAQPSQNKRANQELYATKIKEYGRRFPHAGYGEMFKRWLQSNSLRGYKSYGNGSAMRVSPIGFAFETLEKVRDEAKLSAEVTHNHPEGIKGAQAIASAIHLARAGQRKPEIKAYIEKSFGYELGQSLDKIRLTYSFDSSCKGSVPQAMIAFFESNDFEDAIRKAISLGGDSDTIACMAGGIAQAYYRLIPDYLVDQTMLLLDSQFRETIRTFNKRYAIETSV